jgi:Tfp pilus assembly protein PilZ
MPRHTLPHAAEGAPSDGVLERVRIPFVHRGELVQGDRRHDVFLVDLGLFGSFVELSEAPAVGNRVQLAFRLPANDIPVVVGCRVAWCHAEDQEPTHLPAGAGLAFVDVSPSDRERLRAHLLEHLRSARGARRFARPWPSGGPVD